MSTASSNGGANNPRPGPGAEPVVTVRGLVKRYGRREAVRGVDLDVRRGEIFAFLGPNGAGKTTTVEILEGFRPRTDGEVHVLGVDPAHGDGASRNRVGIVLQESEPEPGLSVRECLELYAGYYRTPRDVDDTIALVGLTEKAEARARPLRRTATAFGRGARVDRRSRHRVLGRAHHRIRPAARHAAWDIIAGLRQLGKTIFLTTHYMEEAEYLADRIAVLARGQIVAEGTPKTLGGRDRMTATIRFTLPDGQRTDDLPPVLSSIAEIGSDGATVLRSGTPLAHLQVLADWALGHGLDLPNIDVRRPTLEEVYLSLTTNSERTPA